MQKIQNIIWVAYMSTEQQQPQIYTFLSVLFPVDNKVFSHYHDITKQQFSCDNYILNQNPADLHL